MAYRPSTALYLYFRCYLPMAWVKMKSSKNGRFHLTDPLMYDIMTEIIKKNISVRSHPSDFIVLGVVNTDFHFFLVRGK